MSKGDKQSFSLGVGFSRVRGKVSVILYYSYIVCFL